MVTSPAFVFRGRNNRGATEFDFIVLKVLIELRLSRPLGPLLPAVRTVTKTPAEAVGLADRGEIASAKCADFIRVRAVDDIAAVRCVWRGGRRVA